jgi:hypothetical protein
MADLTANEDARSCQRQDAAGFFGRGCGPLRFVMKILNQSFWKIHEKTTSRDVVMMLANKAKEAALSR